MKKVFVLIVLMILSFVAISCKETPNDTPNDNENKETTYELSFYKGTELLSQVTYKEGDKVTYPEIAVEDGYYIEWNKEIPNVIDSDVIFVATIGEIKKEYTFVIDGEAVSTKTYKLNEEVVNYEYEKEDGVVSFEWVEESLGEENHTFKYRRTLNKTMETFIVKFMDYNGNVLDEQTVEYGKSAVLPMLDNEYKWANVDYSSVTSDLVIKGHKVTEYKIKYYDNGNSLDLEPKTYKSGIGATLPIPEKDGYEFIGWFVSSISLYPYEKISEDSFGDITLFARYLETVTHNPITLPDATAHITNIKKVPHSSGNGTYVYQPEIPSGYPTSVTYYSWSSSDTTIATISQYSSITGKKAGCCVITGTLNSDPNVTINGLIRVTGDGVVAVTEEEANKINLHTVTFVGKNDEVIKTCSVIDGGSAICPTPLEYDGYKFTGWDKVNYNIKEDTIIKATYRKGTNKYVGLKFSVIGDSISTYQDYIPSGYACFYPYPTADVNDVHMTWWMMMVNKLGAGMFINNSYSGSCASSATGSSASSDSNRLSKLVVGEERPDVIVIYMGSNDCASKYVSEEDFSSGYDKTITKTRELCPDAEIVLCTLPKSKLYYDEDDHRRIAYNNIILSYANKYNLKVCDLASIDISNNLVDSAHPDTSGMKIVANKMVEELLK